MIPPRSDVVGTGRLLEANDFAEKERSELQKHESDTNFSVLQLSNGQLYALRKDNKKYQGWMALLTESAEGEPIYIETEPGTYNVKSILVPLPRKVLYISAEPEEGRLRVILRYCPTECFLNQQLGEVKFGRFRELLQRSRISDQQVLVTTRPATREILDVREVPGGLEDRELTGDEGDEGDEDENEGSRRNEARAIEIQGVKLSTMSAAITADITMAQAIAQFDNMASQPQIPFRYVRDCCTARAHEMCRIMGEAGVRTRKVWNYGSGWAEPGKSPTLHVVTNAVPEGFVDWTYHVAPTVGVRSNSGATRRMVIDPSLFTEPVTISQWVNRQSDLNSEVRRKPANLIWFDYVTGEQFTDPDYRETKRLLRHHRAAFNDESNS